MSYSCMISFKKMEPIEIIPFLVSFKKACNEHLKEIAYDEYGYCPFIREHLTIPENLGDITIEERRTAQAWAHELFKFKYFYNAEMKLLGVFGVPYAIQYLFDGTVHFQNSCDQDYSREDYKGIAEFEEIFARWMTMSWSEFDKEYAKRKGESFDSFIEKEYPEYGNNEMKIAKKMDYYRRSFCYEEIWSHLENHMWHDEDNIFFSVYGGYEKQEIMCFIKYCHEAQLRWEAKELSSNV